MGNLFRRYWLPAILTDELPENDCPPVRVQLLGEKLLAFRDSLGRYGLVDEFCPHRRVSLWFGRNEECGLRCVYHGWKFDVEGKVLDIPSEPEDSAIRKRVKLKAYPLIKVGRVLWTYMGPPEHKPAPPEFEFATVPDKQSYVSKRWQESNYLQAMEGGIDSSHVGWLHKVTIETDPLFQGTMGNKYTVEDAKPVFEVVEQPSGLYIGARRNADNGNYYWRITSWIMPYYTQIPPRGDHPVHGHFWVPIDDENCWAWSYDYHPTRELTAREINAMDEGEGIHCRVDATFHSLANKANDYLMDRAGQKSGRTYSGVEGFAMQDASLQESMGPIVDRSLENLVPTDMGVVMARRQLMAAANALAEKGQEPPGVQPHTHRVRSASVVLRPDQPFKEAAKDALTVQPGKRHASV
jgi:phenylpropionate dioxygenase-like ring-hydroxylating dioxygenase large terminal subunit